MTPRSCLPCRPSSACSARSTDTLEQLATVHQTLRPYPLNVTDPDAQLRAVEIIEENQGPLDLVVLNAGVYEPLPGGLGEPALFRQHMDVNYMGVVNGLMAVLPRMRERGNGQVVIVGSVAGYRGLPNSAAYGPTKAALISLAETMRLEFHGTGVDIRLVNPGFVAARLTEKNNFYMPSMLTPEQAAQRIVRGLQGRGFEISFPFRFVVWLKLARLLPYRWYFSLVKQLPRS